MKIKQESGFALTLSTAAVTNNCFHSLCESCGGCVIVKLDAAALNDGSGGRFCFLQKQRAEEAVAELK